MIGEGFKSYAEGACRWESHNVNGWAVFNNCIDPPVTYRIEDDHVKPIDELAILGVVRVRAIAEYNGFLFLGNVTELTDPTQLEPIKTTANSFQSGALDSTTTDRVQSPPVYVSVEGGALRVSQPFWQSGDVGKVISTPVGRYFQIMVFWDANTVLVIERTDDRLDAPTVDPIVDMEPVTFFLTNLRDDTTLDGSAYYVYAYGNIFQPEWVGRMISWPDGSSKRIEAWINYDRVLVSDDRPVPQGIAMVENHDRSTIGEDTGTDTRPARTIWSMHAEPRRYGLTVDCTFTARSRTLLTTKDITGGFFPGQEIIVNGAGPSGGPLVTFIVSVGPGSIEMADAAETTGTGFVVSSDGAASATGFEDLEDDGSGILKMLRLQERLVIYKDTTNFLCEYTGNVAEPMKFLLVPIPHGRTLHYRYTLVEINGDQHLYAGRNGFYTFDLTGQKPNPLDPIDVLKDLFFDRVTLEDANHIFACDNFITKEVFIVVPKPKIPMERVICFDYRYKTFATSDLPLTAGVTAIRPDKEQNVGETNHWFIMGNSNGTLLLYGMSRSEYSRWTTPEPFVGSIFYRRDTRPAVDDPALHKGGYRSRIKTGKMSFNDDYNEKDMRGYVFHLSGVHDLTQYPVQLTVNFTGTRNVSEPPRLLGTRTLMDARKISLIPVWFRLHNLQEEFVVDGMDNPMRLQGRTFEGDAFPTRSTTRCLPANTA